MDNRERRKELAAEFKQNRPDAGVYRYLNTQSGSYAVGTALNLASARNRLEFAQSVNMPAVLDPRLTREVGEYGIQAFTFEVLEVVPFRHDMTRDELRRELDTLQELWLEKLAAQSAGTATAGRETSS